MSPTSYQLLYPAVLLDCKYTEVFRICKIFLRFMRSGGLFYPKRHEDTEKM